MSFICDRCKKPQPRKAKPHRIVAEIRPKIYEARFKNGYQIDPGGVGKEIVQEKQLCKKCATRKKSKFIL